MAWVLRSVGESPAHLPVFCTTEGIVSELLEGETLNPARQLAAGSYRLCRLGAAGATEVSGEPVWLAGDYHPGEHQIVEVKPAGPGSEQTGVEGSAPSATAHVIRRAWGVGRHALRLSASLRCEQRQPEMFCDRAWPYGTNVWGRRVAVCGCRGGAGEGVSDHRRACPHRWRWASDARRAHRDGSRRTKRDSDQA